MVNCIKKAYIMQIHMQLSHLSW